MNLWMYYLLIWINIAASIKQFYFSTLTNVVWRVNHKVESCGAACSLSICVQVHCCPKHSTSSSSSVHLPASPASLVQRSEDRKQRGWWWGDLRGRQRREGERKVKGEKRTGKELERDHERQKRRERLRQREGAVPRATTAFPPRSHPCVTSPCCKLGYTCSLKMSEHISWWLA